MALVNYAEPARQLDTAVSDALAENSGTVGWREFLDLSDDLQPLLSEDASHPGKLRRIPMTLNPANHDDNIPSRSAIRQVLGDLKFLKKEYPG
jgi:hypothetical protein